MGLSRANLGRLFKEVVQFSPERLRAGGGSGYGLCLVKGIVDLHGGGVAAASDGLGRGATFIVELPMERPLGMHARQVAPSSRTRALCGTPADVCSLHVNCTRRCGKYARPSPPLQPPPPPRPQPQRRRARLPATPPLVGIPARRRRRPRGPVCCTRSRARCPATARALPAAPERTWRPRARWARASTTARGALHTS